MKKRLITIMLLSLGFNCWSQVFIEGYSGYSFASHLRVAEATTATDSFGKLIFDKSELSFKSGNSFGGKIGWYTQDPGSVYLLFDTRKSDIEVTGEATAPLELQMDHYHLGGTAYYPSGNFYPYVSASIGASRLTLSEGYGSETQPSLSIGVGSEYRIGEHLRLNLGLVGYAVLLENEELIFCDPEIQCSWQVDGKAIFQGQANFGISVGF
ncbi:outer membrane beta-barrel protein [Paraferrimonas sp. SM1919]|uniref:outer membrane beta-barrel protein n=1 Tax=Paraferrimonas sp. SM1919 TaxID=2662263 RepID=UPI0013CFAE9E|nr:outer membrane beta-barrel protein [Paraferrimonas sp. SM1919]